MDKRQYKKYISDLLNEHNRQSIDELVALYEDRDFIRDYASQDTELGYIYIYSYMYIS